tara:strand:+ start:2843 stop:3088 length:246 start_codon:yes stop_codon:yes gene_type:complete
MEDRLSRVEAKIDTLQEAIVSLARVEERLSTVFTRQASIESKINFLDEKMQRLTTKIDNRFGERIFWIIIVAATTYFSNII